MLQHLLKYKIALNISNINLSPNNLTLLPLLHHLSPQKLSLFLHHLYLTLLLLLLILLYPLYLRR